MDIDLSQINIHSKVVFQIPAAQMVGALTKSPWAFENRVTIRSPHWHIILVFAQKVLPEMFTLLNKSLVIRMDNNLEIGITSSEISQLISLIPKFNDILKSTPPLVPVPADNVDELTNDAYIIMMAGLLELLQVADKFDLRVEVWRE